MSTIKSIAVIGLGYVGLPLALLASEKGFSVTGLDIDSKKLKSLKNKRSYIDDVSDEEIAKTKAFFTDDFSKIKEIDAAIVCVPTPIDKNKKPDLSPAIGAVSAIAPNLKNGALVVIESTVNPGVCDDTIAPLLEKESGKKVGRDIYLAHCPERINPGDPKWSVRNINRVVGANSKKELDMAVELYRNLIDGEIKPMASLKEAEAVKVVENSFRDINIAFVNELAKSFHKLGINLENVIDGASTKPFSFMPHHPGCGVGGHCIPVDPYYLIEYASQNGFDHKFLKLARDINESMPQFTVDLLKEALDGVNLPLKDTRVALLGLSYKANVGDDRESPSYEIIKILKKHGIKLKIYDPYILNKSTIKSLEASLKDTDAIVIASGHDEFKKVDIDDFRKNKIKIIIDGRNIYKNKSNKFKKIGIVYKGIGL